MGRKIVVDVTELGRAGGKATAANRTPEQRRAAARRAIAARWDKYYREHPDQLKVKKEREAKRAVRPRPAPKKQP